MSDKNAITLMVRLAKQISNLTVEERTLFDVLLQMCDLQREDPETMTKLMEEFIQKHKYEDPYKDKMYEHD